MSLRCSAAAALLASAVGLASPALADDVQGRIAGEALVHGGAYELARSLADVVGNRITGSPAAERATAWAERALRQLGASSIRREKVTVPVWVRGEESAELLGPSPHRLVMTALGG